MYILQFYVEKKCFWYPPLGSTGIQNGTQIILFEQNVSKQTLALALSCPWRRQPPARAPGPAKALFLPICRHMLLATRCMFLAMLLNINSQIAAAAKLKLKLYWTRARPPL